MAANTDLLKKLSRRWVGQIGAGGVADAVVTTIPLSSTTNLPTSTAVVATINRVDANGVATPAQEETIIGVVSGSNLVTCTRGVEGTAQAHDAGDVVEILVTAKGWNDLVDHLLVQHDQLGYHTNITASNITASAVTTSPNYDIGSAGAIRDTNDNELIKFPATVASAVNEVTVTNAATGDAPSIAATGGDTNIDISIIGKGTGGAKLTSPKIVTGINDTNGNELVKVTPTASAVNEVTLANAATGGVPTLEATGDDTNIHLSLKGKGNGLVKIAVLRQDITTNSYAVNQVMLTGFNFVTGDGSATGFTKTITFGITFASKPVVVIGQLGYKDTTDPTDIGDFANVSFGQYGRVGAPGITTTTFTAATSSTEVVASGRRLGFSWIAIGTLT